MTKKIIANVTDTHLGQRLVMGGQNSRRRIRYDDEPEEHKDHLRLILDDISHKGTSEVVFGGDIGTKESVGEFFELLIWIRFHATSCSATTMLTALSRDIMVSALRRSPGENVLFT